MRIHMSINRRRRRLQEDRVEEIMFLLIESVGSRNNYYRHCLSRNPTDFCAFEGTHLLVQQSHDEDVNDYLKRLNPPPNATL